MTEQVPSKELVRRIDDCLNRFWIDGVAEVRARGLLREAMEALRATAEPQADQPVAWVIPGDDNAYANGALDARISQEGEFTRPLYARPAPPPSLALSDVAAERERQKSVEGWTPEHDDEHSNGELAQAAACYALEHQGWRGFSHSWPWAPEWWKPKDRRRNLVRAGALILAEIERLDRATSTKEVSRDSFLHETKTPSDTSEGLVSPPDLMFQEMEASTAPLTHQEVFSAVHHHASEIVRLTAAVPTQCSGSGERNE